MPSNEQRSSDALERIATALEFFVSAHPDVRAAKAAKDRIEAETKAAADKVVTEKAAADAVKTAEAAKVAAANADVDAQQKAEVARLAAEHEQHQSAAAVAEQRKQASAADK